MHYHLRVGQLAIKARIDLIEHGRRGDRLGEANFEVMRLRIDAQPLYLEVRREDSLDQLRMESSFMNAV